MNNTPKVISSTPFESLRFQFSWRNYQEKFLEHFETHLNDNHLHVVAPPGSGKTILGLEMLRRVQKKTIVFAPTLTIRNQWKDRLLSFFTDDNAFADFSLDIKKPAALTFVTYQSLHAFYKSFETKETFLAFFEAYGIEAIVLDEAHHLKNEWWKCLFALKDARKLTTIALTATPPIDSTDQELSRYFELCGPIDEEIAVPDLVKEGDLCPHQDFIYFSEPHQEEIESIVAFRKNVASVVENLKQDESFSTWLKFHRFLINTDNFLEEIYKEPSYFSSILIFLNAVGEPINQLLNPIENPRYLIEKTSLFGEVADWQSYYAVPSIFEGKKEDAAVFLGIGEVCKRRKIAFYENQRRTKIAHQSSFVSCNQYV